MMKYTFLFFFLLLLWARPIICIEIQPIFIESENCTILRNLLTNSSGNTRTLSTNNKTTSSSATNGVVNTHVLTLFNYENSQVYIYSPISNEDTSPEKWIFYYIPLMLPAKQDSGYNERWIWSTRNEIRVRLMLGNKKVEDLARQAIAKKYQSIIAENASKHWDIAPLMIDSLTAYVVRGDSSPVPGVQPYRIVHPNSLVMTFRFSSTIEEQAKSIVDNIYAGNYDIEVSLYFAEFKQVSTNYASITADQLKNVLSKTTADGGNTNAQYIHRNQASKFVGQYITNVKKMIYIEDPNPSVSSLTADLDEQFISLLQQGMDNSQKTVIDVKFYDQLWSPLDFEPDRITTELNKVFTKNDSETKRHNDSDTYFNLNTDYLTESSAENAGSGSGSMAISIFGGIHKGKASVTAEQSSSSSNSLADHLSQTNQEIFSTSDLQRLLTQQDSDIQWTGEKLVPKSLKVYKLTDLTDRLQVAIIAKQLIADKKNGAIIRTVSTLNMPIAKDSNETYVWSTTTTTTSTTTTTEMPLARFITGTIQIYAGSTIPPWPWLLCDGSNVSRATYPRLFSVIGETYGAGNRYTTFNLPDFRGRVPVGLDRLNMRVSQANQLGSVGGQALHQLTTSQLPAHKHSPGSLSTSTSGSHSHSIYDPGHDHGGSTGNSMYGGGGMGMKGGGYGDDGKQHDHPIPIGQTHILINSNGSHFHTISSGETGSVGNGESFSLMPPYQTVNYIIYAN